MQTFSARSLKIAAVMLATACSSSVEPNVDDGTCPQTYEFGNYGCARAVVIVNVPLMLEMPVARRWDVRAVPLVAQQLLVGGLAETPGPGANSLQLTRMLKAPTDPQDEVPTWVTARILDDSNQRTSPLPTVAIDSVLHVFKFAPVGSRPRVDTIYLTVRKP